MSPIHVREPGEDPMKKTIIVALTIVFTGLYVIAILGRWKWNSDKEAIQLLQPIVYVIIGYFFGRMPSEATERSLRSAAEEKAQQASDAHAKLRSVRAVLAQAPAAASSVPGAAARSAEVAPGSGAASQHDVLARNVAVAIKLIDEGS